MKKLSVAALAVLMVAMLIGSASRVSADDNTYVYVEVTGENVEVQMNVNSTGSVSMVVDGVPLQETFNGIGSAINSLSSYISSVAGTANTNTYRISVLTSRMNAQDVAVQTLENAVIVAINNTLYLKAVHDNLEERFDSTISLIWDNTEFNTASINGLKGDYKTIYDMVYRQHENKINGLMDNLTMLAINSENSDNELKAQAQAIMQELTAFKNDCDTINTDYGNRLISLESRLDNDENRLDSHEDRLNNLELDYIHVSIRADDLEAKNVDLETRNAELETRRNAVLAVLVIAAVAATEIAALLWYHRRRK